MGEKIEKGWKESMVHAYSVILKNQRVLLQLKNQVIEMQLYLWEITLRKILLIEVSARQGGERIKLHWLLMLIIGKESELIKCEQTSDWSEREKENYVTTWGKDLPSKRKEEA